MGGGGGSVGEQINTVVNTTGKRIEGGLKQAATGVSNIVRGNVAQGAGEIMSGSVTAATSPLTSLVDSFSSGDPNALSNALTGADINQRMDIKRSIYQQLLDNSATIDDITKKEIFQALGGEQAAATSDVSYLTGAQLASAQDKLKAVMDKLNPMYKSRWRVQEMIKNIEARPTARNILTDRNPLMQGSEEILTGAKK